MFCYLKIFVITILCVQNMIAQENTDSKSEDNFIWQDITEEQQVFDFQQFRLRTFQKEDLLLIEIISNSPRELTEKIENNDEAKKCIASKKEGTISHKSWEKIDTSYSIEINTPSGSLFIRESLSFYSAPSDLKKDIDFLGKLDIKSNSVRILLQQGIFKFNSLDGNEIYFYHFEKKSYFRMAEENIIDLAIFFLEKQKENASNTKRPGQAH